MRIWLAALVLWLLALPALAHEVRPALLQITELGPGRYDVLWKQPAVGEMTVHLVPHLSSGVLDAPSSQEALDAGFLVRAWRVEHGPPLDGQTVTIEGLPLTVTDVLLRIVPADGAEVSSVIRPAQPSAKIALGGRAGLAVPAYLRLGVEHILTGFDHLLFVFGLFLLVGPTWRLVKAITAFTVAHSLTLALATLGYVRFPPAAIEALVALSILFLATELARPAGAPPTLARRRPWLIAFTFGLLHGLAFAGALSQVGLPARAAPQALFLFNAGVEIGQLAFIALCLAVAAMWRRVPSPAIPRAAPAYLIGGLSAWWLIERVAAAVT